jgi:hypothetical protein
VCSADHRGWHEGMCAKQCAQMITEGGIRVCVQSSVLS